MKSKTDLNSERAGVAVDALVRLIEAAPIDTNIDLESIGHVLKKVSFSLDDGEYCWIGERSWKNARNVGYVHPMKNTQYVKTFKTLAGAKRNFLKRWSGDYSFVPNTRKD